MNKFVKSTGLMILAGAMVNLSAAKIEITPTVAKQISKKDKTLQDSKVLLGIRGTAFINDNVGIQAVLESSKNNKTLGTGGAYGKTDIERGTLNAVYEVTGHRVRPYGVVGVGYERTHDDSLHTVTNNNDDSQVFYNAGVGVKFGINDNIDLVTEVKGIHKAENGDNDIIGTVGVGVKFGETAQKEPVCAAPKALSLQEFAKMCKTPVAKPVTVTPQEVATMPVQQVVATHENVPAQMSVQEDQTPENCVVEVEADQSVEVPSGDVVPEGSYVQMAALFKGNGDLLTSKLEHKHYPYILHNTKRFGKDATLVLVGPYASAKEAGVALKYLKRLSRKAFIKRFP